MKVEITVDGKGGQQRVVDAGCFDPSFNDLENLLDGKIPLDADSITQHECDICQVSHKHAAVLALENVSDWLPPTNARLLRNLTLGANFLQSHILHFYFLAALDYVSVPATAPWTSAWQADIRPGLDSIAANLPAALGARRRAHEMSALLGGKSPSGNSIIPGGFATVPTKGEINSFRQHLNTLTEFIASTYLPDVQLLGTVYSDYFEIGAGCRNLLAYGAFAMDDANSSHLFNGGYIENGQLNVQPVKAIKNYTEAAEYTRFTDETHKQYSIQEGTRPDYPKSEANACFGTRQLHGIPFEKGPMARMWINGEYQRSISVMDRHVVRALETEKIAAAMSEWLDQLVPGQNAYDVSFHQHSGSGVGLSEAPNGALGHWVEVSESKIVHKQVNTPTCWAGTPGGKQEVAGPMEQALIGTSIENPDQPVEALRIIHSYDPCLFYDVHIMRPGKKPMELHN